MTAGIPMDVFEALETALEHFGEYLEDHGEDDYSPEDLSRVWAAVEKAEDWLGGQL